MTPQELEWAMTHETDWIRIAKHEMKLATVKGRQTLQPEAEIGRTHYVILAEFCLAR